MTSSETPNCLDCHFAGADPDGTYCGEEHSLKNSSGYGRNLSVARSEDCGAEGKFFRIASEETLRWRGRWKETT